MTVDAMKTWYHASICKWIRGIATVFIAQQSIENYNGDAAIMDIIAIDQDVLLVPLGLTIPQFFLFVYKTSNKLPLLPTPTVNCTFQNVINQINGASINPPPLPNKDDNVIAVYNPNQEQLQDKEMVNALDKVEQKVAIGGRTILYQLINKIYIDSIITPSKISMHNSRGMPRQRGSKMPSPLQVSRTLPSALLISSDSNRLLSNQSFGD